MELSSFTIRILAHRAVDQLRKCSQSATPTVVANENRRGHSAWGHGCLRSAGRTRAGDGRLCARTQLCQDICRGGIAGRRGQRRSAIRLRVLHLRGVVIAIPAFASAASDETPEAEQSKGGFTCDARRAKIDRE